MANDIEIPWWVLIHHSDFLSLPVTVIFVSVRGKTNERLGCVVTGALARFLSFKLDESVRLHLADAANLKIYGFG